MSVSKPTIIIVPGAWHAPSSYDKLAEELKAANFTALIASHPSLNSKDPKSVSCTQDTAAVRSILLPLLDKGEDVVLVAHSYGGVSASGAAHGLSKVSRAKAGKESGVLGIVYIAGFLIPTGLNMDGMIGPPPYLVPNQPSPGLCETNSPAEVFYYDLDSDAAATMVQALEPQALGAFVTDAPPTAWQEPEYDGRLAYVRTTEDRAVPSFVQDVMMKKSQAKWLVKDIETSHSPFLSRPKELTGLILDCVDTFLSAGASRLATSKLS